MQSCGPKYWLKRCPIFKNITGKTVVVKYGGNAMIYRGTERRAVIHDIVLLNLVGIQVVVVHGGGPEISEMLNKIGKESRFVDGLRYTDRGDHGHRAAWCCAAR